MADILYKLDECIICSSKAFFKTTFKQCDKSIHQKKKKYCIGKVIEINNILIFLIVSWVCWAKQEASKIKYHMTDPIQAFCERL